MLRRCLAAETGNRYQSARELREALAAVPLDRIWTADDAEAFCREADRRRFG